MTLFKVPKAMMTFGKITSRLLCQVATNMIANVLVVTINIANITSTLIYQESTASSAMSTIQTQLHL